VLLPYVSYRESMCSCTGVNNSSPAAIVDLN